MSQYWSGQTAGLLFDHSLIWFSVLQQMQTVIAMLWEWCACAGSRMQDTLSWSLAGNRLYMPSLGWELLSVIAREAPQEIPNSLLSSL